MNKEQLFNNICTKKSFLCVGLDTDLSKIPPHLLETEDPVFEFNKSIINATIDYCVAYKPNYAFYEANGLMGLQSLFRTMEYLEPYREQVFLIADAKRGDIGNTSGNYARAFFDKSASGFDFDAVTVAPYMGVDSVSPFLDFPGKWAILLALTSNKGAFDFQFSECLLQGSERKLFEHVLETSKNWGSSENMMFVVGATQAEMLSGIRKIVPDHFLLVPGVGAQGGSLQDVVSYGINKQCGLIVNASRSILYASSGLDFAAKAREEAASIQKEMERELINYKII